MRETPPCRLWQLHPNARRRTTDRLQPVLTPGWQLKTPQPRLGFGEQLPHIETVAPNGAMLVADEALAMRRAAAARTGVRSIILGGAGLAGYAQRLRPHVALPLIDSAQAGLQELLAGQAPAAVRTEDGFVADWSAC